MKTQCPTCGEQCAACLRAAQLNTAKEETEKQITEVLLQYYQKTKQRPTRVQIIEYHGINGYRVSTRLVSRSD